VYQFKDITHWYTTLQKNPTKTPHSKRHLPKFWKTLNGVNWCDPNHR